MEELNLDRWLIRLTTKLNYSRPTPIQKLVIPAILQGKNVLGIIII